MRNDAQHAFHNMIELLEPEATTELVITEALHGELNLAALGNAGFKRIAAIRFMVEGELTEISNIPETVKILEISKQKLSHLNHLPAHLLELDVHGNDLIHFSAKALPHLTRLNVNNNRLETLTFLPATLEELECNNNVLKRLDLSTTVVLKKLHCRNNPLLTVERLPPVATDLEYDSTPFLEMSFQGDEEDGKGKDVVVRKRDFNLRVCLQRYFELKQQYEQDLRIRRRRMKERALKKGMSLQEALRKARNVKPKCVQCGDAGDTQFSHDKQHYRAKCNHCDLKIDIFMGDHDSVSTLIDDFREHMEDSKQAIIEQKMQTLFGFLDKRHSTELFKMNMDTYREVSDNCRVFLAKYEQVYDNPERKKEERDLLERVLELQQDVGRILRQYKSTGDRALLRQAMSDHIHQLVPAAQALQRHRYPHMWMERRDNSEDEVLVQRKTAFEEDDIVYGEAARVIQFSNVV
jgi:hypothetical protein